MNKKIKILFTVSVVANVLLLSMAGGMAYRHMKTDSWHQVRKSLAPETKHIMGRVFQKNFKELKPVMQQAQARKKVLMKVLTAAKFDQVKFAREAKKLQKAQAKIRGAKILSMGELAAALPLEEREKLSVLFERSLSEGRGHRSKHGDRDKKRGGMRKSVKPVYQSEE